MGRDAYDLVAEDARVIHTRAEVVAMRSVDRRGLDDGHFHMAVVSGQVAALALSAAVVSQFGDGAVMLRALHDQLDQSWCDAQRLLAAGAV